MLLEKGLILHKQATREELEVNVYLPSTPDSAG
jgi:hypothetical protein